MAKGMNKGRLVGMIMSLIISLAMGIVSSLLVIATNPNALQAHSAFFIYATNILLLLILGFLISLLLPFGRLGEALARKANAAPLSIKFILLNAIPHSVGSTFIISLALSFFGVFTARMKLPEPVLSTLPPFHIMWIGSWFRLLLPTLLISYTLSVLLAPVIARLVGYGKPGRPAK